ncbi:hypothetical protein EI94DRAFT_1145959 [Lactarius quietus]|nr:hypothetical protein EI94DRAFT_1145959 [Lactarius quietus]
MAYLIGSYKSTIDRRTPYIPAPQDISSSESEVDYVLPALPGEWPGDPTTPGGHTTVESTVSMRISDPTSSELTWGVHRRLGGLVERPMKRRESLTPPRRHVMIEALPEDALLNIFSFHQMSSPSHWHRLAHVCRKWRYIILESPRTLNLRLYCASGRLS